MIKSKKKTEKEKFDEFAKMILTQNPDCRTTVSLIELLCKHGVAKAIFKQTKTAYVTGQDEVEIECGKNLQNIQMLLLAFKESI